MAPVKLAAPLDDPVRVPAVITLPAAWVMVPPASTVTDPAPALTAPAMVRLPALTRKRLPLAPFSTPIWLAPAKVAPAELAVRVPAVITLATSWVIVPVSVKVTVPAPALIAPNTVRLGTFTRVRLPPLVVKPLRAAIWLASAKLAFPTDEPVRVPVVITPVDWPIAPAEIRSTLPPVAVRLPFRLRPPTVVVRVKVSPAPASTGPVTPRAWALVRLKPPTPVLVKAPSAPIRFAPVSVVPP